MDFESKKIWRYGDDVDTDVIIPARYLAIADWNELAEHAMEDIVNFPIKYTKTSKIFFEIPPFAITMPDNTNIGTASSGKLSIPPSIDRMTN